MLTILCVHLVSAEGAPHTPPPEEIAERVAGVAALVGEAIVAHGGYVAHLAGDGVLAFFGTRGISAGIETCERSGNFSSFARCRCKKVEPAIVRDSAD